VELGRGGNLDIVASDLGHESDSYIGSGRDGKLKGGSR